MFKNVFVAAKKMLVKILWYKTPGAYLFLLLAVYAEF